MGNTLSIKQSIKAEDLETKLKKATSLSDDQIKEIVPVVLNSISAIQKLEEEKTESTTKENLLELNQSITNDSNVSIDMKNNKGTVIGTMNFNEITNHISITINNIGQQTPPVSEASEQNQNTTTSEQTTTETTSEQNQNTTTSEQTTTEATSEQTTTETTSGQTTTEATSEQTTTETTSGQTTTEATSEQTTTETTSGQTTTEATSEQTTTEATSEQTTTEATSEQTAQIETQSETTSEINLDTYEGYNKALSQLIFEIEGCASTAKYKRGLNKSGKETLKTAKAKLKQYKDIISDKKRMLEHEFKQKNKLNAKNPDKVPLTVSISASEINGLKKRRGNRRQTIEEDIKAGQRGESSNTAPWPNQSLEQINKGNNVDRHHIEYDSKLNEALQDAALLRVFDNNQDRVREFLQAIANNSLSDAQITICQTRMVQLAPCFEKYGLTDQVHRCIQTRGGRYTQSIINYGNMDGETAYKTGGVTGWLKNTLIKAFPNAKPEQVSNFTNIAVAAGGIYAIYRIGKWFFGKNEKGERNLGGKIAGLAGIYFAPQLLLGKDGFSLLGDILSGKADFGELGYRASNCLWFLNNNSPEVYAQMAPGVLGMSIFPQNYTVRDVRSLQQSFSDQNARRQWYTVTYNRLNNDNSSLANEFKNTFNANQYDENERKAFLAKLGITENTNEDTVIFNEASKLTDKKTSLELWMKSQGKKRNPTFKKEIDDYLKQEGEFNPNNLNPNWFITIDEATYTERPEDIQNKEKLETQIESLSISDSQKKSELKTAIKRFYDERNIDTKPNLNDFSLRTEDGYVILTSHGGQEAKIDTNKNEISGFGNGIRFSDLSELFNVADLSNKILETQKGKQPKDLPPFQYKIGKGGRGIYFNDAEGWNFNFDTRVLSGGRGGTIGKIGTLSNNADEFANYLSKRWENSNKVNLDSYAILKEVGITFTNKDEAIKSEELLKYIKNELRMYEKRDVGTAFEISTEITTKTYIKFFTKGGKTKEFDISDYPTFKNNKDQLLKYLNNPSNKMRQSQRPI